MQYIETPMVTCSRISLIYKDVCYAHAKIGEASNAINVDLNACVH